jgi:hypothetical protein
MGPGDPGRATIGFYTITDGVLTMTGDGKAVRRKFSGEPYKHKLEPDDDPVIIAKRRTLSIYRSNTDDGLGGFNRPLSYPKLGLA